MRGHPAPSAATVALLGVLLAACGRSRAADPIGDPEQGALLVAAHGCGGCHTIPGITGAGGTIGPPLARFATRAYIAGKLPNQFGNLTRWIRTPQALEPGTAMPNLAVTEAEARAIASYLYTLR